MAHASAIKSLDFSFAVRQNDGWRCEGHFFGEEDRFRVNRRDVVGMRFGDGRLPLQISAPSFDGKRHQHRDDVAKRLRLKDGSADASYSLSTPQVFAYQWLQQPGAVFRWDMVRDEATWQWVAWRECSCGVRDEASRERRNESPAGGNA